MEKEGTLIRLAELWRNEDIKNRDLLLIARDGMMIQGSTPHSAKLIANLLLSVMIENAVICEGVKLAAKHYDSVAEDLRNDEAKPDGKKAIDIENACKACENELRRLKTLLNERGVPANLISIGKSLSNIRKEMEG